MPGEKELRRTLHPRAKHGPEGPPPGMSGLERLFTGQGDVFPPGERGAQPEPCGLESQADLFSAPLPFPRRSQAQEEAPCSPSLKSELVPLGKFHSGRSWKMRELGSGDEEDGWKLFPHPVLPSLLLVWVARFPREPGALAPLASPEHLRISCFHDPKEPQSRLWKSCGN